METPTIGNDEIIAIVIVLLIWSVVAAIPARYAKRKGYNFWVAFLACFFFMLPASFIISMLSPKSATPSVTQQLRTQQICAICGKVNLPSATSCAGCGMAFAPVSATTQGGVTPQLSEETRANVDAGNTRFCSNCGRLNNPTRSTCKSCGSTFAV